MPSNGPKASWNRCDVCGRFIPLNDFERGAVRLLIYPDSEFTQETWETLCAKHADDASKRETVNAK
jgi:hypothetical protein